jgi:hypothetical protein
MARKRVQPESFHGLVLPMLFAVFDYFVFLFTRHLFIVAELFGMNPSTTGQ